MLPIVDESENMVGILHLRDLLHIIMSTFVALTEDFEYVGDFGAMEDLKPPPEELKKSITEVMQEPICVQVDSGLVRAFAFIHKHELLDLPVINRDGQLVGLASRVDIGRALLITWCQDAIYNQS